MLLADMGADVVCVRRPSGSEMIGTIVDRGKRTVPLDLKTASGLASAWQLIEAADVVIEGFRPGVMERLGLGPESALGRNPRLIYARITGWGDSGPLSQRAGHDINYIALAGALAAIGRPDGEPTPPLNLIGDYGGGSLYLVFGIACALIHRNKSGQGQVVEAAMIDGVASLMANRADKVARDRGSLRGQDHLDGSAHYYRSYRCADGAYITVGAIEPAFYHLLWSTLGWADRDDLPTQDETDWERGIQILSGVFVQQPRSYWDRLFADTDVCYSPVLPIEESFNHPQIRQRDVYVHRHDVWQPNVAPRLSGSPGEIQGPPNLMHAVLSEVLEEWTRLPAGRAPEETKW